MSCIPIVRQYEPDPGSVPRDRAHRLAGELLDQQPELRPGPLVRQSTPEKLLDAPTLHLDDVSSIPLLDRFHDVTCVQDRARLRADSGDFVAVCGRHVPAFEAYSSERLGLGSVTWLNPRSKNPLAIASACWTDKAVRERLIDEVKANRLRYLHPHMGTLPVWVLATSLRRATNRTVEVIAPPPSLTQSINDKVWFADVAKRLLGQDAVLRTHHVWNYATLSRLVRDLAADSRELVVKIPDSAGGAGNLVLRSDRFRSLNLGEISALLKHRLADLEWEGRQHVLVGSWESDVLSAPSVQIWIPPPAEGLPIVEGLFQQMIAGREGFFIGSRPARLPQALERAIVEKAWLLTVLFQELGYIGRCSFDLVLVGEDPQSCQPRFVECNGRWGGTSLPMTLMNRIFGDWRRQPYAARETVLEGLEHLDFGELLAAFGDDLYDAGTRRGNLLVFNPRALGERSSVHVIALAEGWDRAEQTVCREVPDRLRRLIDSRDRPG